MPQEENVSWNQQPFHTDLIWDHSVGHHVRRPSEGGSFSASSVDEMIRNLVSPPNPDQLLDPPAVVMARMTGNPPHIHPSSAPDPRVTQSPTARPRDPAPPLAMPAESSAFVAPWNDHTMPLHFEQHSTSSIHSSMRQSGPEVYVDVTTNIQAPSPRRSFAGYTGAQGVAGPSSRREEPRTPRQSSQRGDRIPSRASVLSYVSIPRGTRQHEPPIDVDAIDAMDVDEGGAPAPAPPVSHPPFFVDPFAAAPPMHAPPMPAHPMPAHPMPAPPRPAPPMPAPPAPAPMRPAPPTPAPQTPAPPMHAPLMQAPPVPAPPMPAPPAANPRRAPVNHPIFNEQLLREGTQVASGIDWLNADFTRAPPKGWKRVQFRSLRDVLKGQDKEQAKRWTEIAKLRKCLLIQIAGCGGCDDDFASWQSYELMKELVLILFGVSRRQLLPPQQEAGAPAGSNIAPYYTLATDLSDHQIAAMLGWTWVSTKWLSVNFVAFPTPLPTYVATWESSTAFVSSAPQDVEDMLAAGFNREPLLSTTARIIRSDKDAGAAGRWGDTSLINAFNATVNSVRVDMLPRLVGPQNTPAPLYAMYCDPPTANEKDWEVFRDAIQAHAFGVDGGRNPDLFVNSSDCRICHSADHSVGLCYLDSVEGWNGPRRENYTNQAAPSTRGGRNRPRGGNQQRGGGNQQRGGGDQQRGRGRGGRGRGRGGNGRPAAGQSLDQNASAALLRAASGGWPHQR
ncbi:uncharacterized protein C8Q71DRAFT_855666 [Rhodofomes roseus]|uniref:Uncharacterized protein n=1 Tax=Rhodofomes roseus TaxID=34475 RepID=A0ABQ8KMC7_9APHY|nr:uncharacterized protein C8Q71DRAFT_855666 [Rhodofomes roseus]KAH9839015.1 hypothetical protein C8Q71DRAFT_855666 [Rhodofomes roseus]